MPARNIKAVVAYDGTGFFGWQSQKKGRTVQEELQKSLQCMHSHRVHLHAAGRTDSGVHADGQVVNFFTDMPAVPAERFAPALNSRLPGDVRVLSTQEVPDEFHARYSARARVYRYFIHPGPIVAPVQRHYCLRLGRSPDLSRLNRLAGCLPGRHDFTTFSALADRSSSKVREVYSAAFYPDGPFIVFRIAASSFLWRMVRSIVGSLLELEGRDEPADSMRAALAARDRGLAGSTAPAVGLFLHKVIYDESASLY
jgi:tRNA pseudouridine38-40 synthase